MNCELIILLGFEPNFKKDKNLPLATANRATQAKMNPFFMLLAKLLKYFFADALDQTEYEICLRGLFIQYLLLIVHRKLLPFDNPFLCFFFLFFCVRLQFHYVQFEIEVARLINLV